jgi:hypothetical protein
MRQTWKALMAAVVAAGLSAFSVAAPAQSVGDRLERGFADPPDAARPRTWWHWTGSNVTLEGITKDLVWMKRAGIAGLQLADVNGGGGRASRRRSCSELRSSSGPSATRPPRPTGSVWR